MASRAEADLLDAIYVALAELLDEPLITHDKRIANASGHSARVTLV